MIEKSITMTEPIVLWNNFREGSDQAFSDLFDLYSETLYRYGLKFDLDCDLVKDSIQDVFVHLYNHKNLPSVDNPKYYLLRALKNNLLNKLAKQKQIPTVSLQDLPFLVEYEMSEIENISDVDERDDLEEKLKFVIELLPPRQKEALYLRFQLEMSYEEISDMLSLNYQSTRNLIHRAVKNVRSHIELSVFLMLLT